MYIVYVSAWARLGNAVAENTKAVGFSQAKNLALVFPMRFQEAKK
jgi:hypothetical protein